MPTHDVSTKRIAAAGVTIATGVALAVVVVFALLQGWWHVPPGADPARADHDSAMPDPALQSAPQLDLDRYLEEKRHALNSGGWVNAQRGVVHIPIATAMDLLAQSAASGASAAAERP